MSVFHNNALAGASGQAGGAAAYEIERSLRFNSADSAYCRRYPSSASNQKTWTWSGWVKRSAFGTSQYFFGNYHTSAALDGTSFRFTASDQIDIFDLDSGSFAYQLTSTQVFRDPSAWYHFVIALDTTQATAADRLKVYVNGSEITVWTTSSYPSQNTDYGINNTYQHAIGRSGFYNGQYFNGYLADVHFIDGQALSPTDFGEFDDNNVWQPIEYTGSYGTNGFHLDFSDNSSVSALGTDSSGNGNNWTVSNLSVTAGAGNDSLLDSPTNGTQTDTGAGGEVRGNYATFNPLAIDNRGGSAGGQTLNGNLVAKATNTSEVNTPLSIRIPASGKYYLEINCDSTQRDPRIFIYSGFDMDADGYIDALGTNAVAGSLYGFAFDRDTNNLYVYRNNTLINTVTTMDSTRSYAISVYDYDGTGWQYTLNAGQRPFIYSKSGYKALCTANLPDPTIADGSTAMDVVTYSSTNAIQAITLPGSGFQPDFVWTKSRSNAYQHDLYDAVRGAGSYLVSNSTAAAGYDANTLKSFDSAGFTLGNSDDSNFGSGTSVAWCWDGGTAFSNSAGTNGATIASSGYANQDAGFSIVTYTGTGSNASVGHGLGVSPGLIIIKGRDTTFDWRVWHPSFATGYDIQLNQSTAVSSAPTVFQSAPTSSVINLGTGAAVNQSTKTYVAYCWAPVEGYSSFGSYTGNGSSDGPFVYTGHRSRWLMIKRTDTTGSWYVMDTARDTYNYAYLHLYPNLSLAEGVSSHHTDLLSNGFKARGSAADLNASGGTYIFASFAENPFKYARAR